MSKLNQNTMQEFIHEIIEHFEDFLDMKGIELDNPEKQEVIDAGQDEDTVANIYGTDYGWLQSDIEGSLKDWGIINNDRRVNKPFIITEDQYNRDKINWGKKEFIVFDDVCTLPVGLYTINDETIESFIGKELLMKAREMAPYEKMYVRNLEMEIDIELLRAEGDYNEH